MSSLPAWLSRNLHLKPEPSAETGKRGSLMRSYILLIICALIVGTAMASSRGVIQDKLSPEKRQRTDMEEFESQYPLTDGQAPGPSDPNKHARWRAKGKKYKDIGLPVTEKSGWITVNTEWDMGLPALPAANSDLIVIGEVTDTQAYLTEAKDWVYSEFTIRVDEVLKNTSAITVKQHDSLVVDRDGGRMRFPSGHIVLQYIPGQGMPRAGRCYVLFLTLDDQSAHILTGYELRTGRVFPLDNPAGGQHPLATTYRDADETSFLSDLRAAITSGH